MDYSIQDIEDQILATLDASSDLSGVPSSTHAGQINIQMFIDPKYYEGLLPRLPCIFVRYKGRTATMRDGIGKIWAHELQWEFYVCSQSLRATKESQRDCYTMLGAIFDAIAGKWCKATTVSSQLLQLNGTQIANAYFREMSSFLEVGGQDEKLIIQLPVISVYSTSYKVTVQTGK